MKLFDNTPMTEDQIDVVKRIRSVYEDAFESIDMILECWKQDPDYRYYALFKTHFENSHMWMNKGISRSFIPASQELSIQYTPSFNHRQIETRIADISDETGNA